MWTDIKSNTNMGLQSTLATKRKHELTLDNEKESDFQSSCPPLKTTKWSNDRDSIQENNNNNSNNNNNNDSNNNKQQQHQLQQQQETQQIHENNITTKLEVVTATPNDLWNSEPVDCISKLQAVAVPTDTWGSLTTRSTLATTLLSADEMEDDDDDFDDDYEEEESVIPTYCPVRYTCPPPHFLQRNNGGGGNNNNNNNNNGSNSPTTNGPNNNYSPHINNSTVNHNYLVKPNYYSEPFPQQNCSRTINQQQQQHQQSQHFRFGTLNSWNHLNSHQNNSNYYNMQANESPTLPAIGSSNGIISGGGYTQQQTIRCAENGKSYLELGSSTFSTLNSSTINNNINNSNNGNSINSRHSKKCGCDGRGIWCNSKNCYRDVRLKIRNLSMFKLSKFRQVSEQSLYRSVLICNTLKNIDKEIELENKDNHLLHHPHHMNPHLHHPLNHHHHHSNASPLTALSANNNNHFSPIGSCTKVCVIPHDHMNSLVFQSSSNQFSNLSNSDNESTREYNAIQQHQQQQQQQQQQQHQHQLHQHQQQTMLNKSSSTMLFNSGSNNQQHCPNELLHPYDHYPFREAQLGRATPFPMGSNGNDNSDLIPITSSPVSPIVINNNNNNNSTSFVSSASSIVSNTISPTSISSSSLTTTTLTPIINSTSSTTATTTTTTNLNQQNPASVSPESDSGYSDDDSNRSINWSSVLSLSSQSALDPLNNNDLFSILPSPATPTPITTTTSTSLICNNTSNNSSSNSSTTNVATNSTLTTISSRNNNNNNDNTSNNTSISTSNNLSNNNNNNNNNSISTTHVTTLSTLTSLSSSSSSSITTTTSNHHLILENNNNCSASSIQTNNLTWEYNFLDMDLGIGSELTELVPSPPHHCKLISDDLFKSISTPLNTTSRYVHDNEIESPAHIMVGS